MSEIKYLIQMSNAPDRAAHFLNSCMQFGTNIARTRIFMVSVFLSAVETTQMEDPRQEWRTIQENMLREYLQTAQDALEVSLVLIFSFLSARDNFMLILCVNQQTPWRTLYVSICYGCRNSYSQKYF
jgi:hypothetical protein